MSVKITIVITEIEPGKMVAGVSAERLKAGCSDRELLVNKKLMEKINKYISDEFRATATICKSYKENNHVH